MEDDKAALILNAIWVTGNAIGEGANRDAA